MTESETTPRITTNALKHLKNIGKMFEELDEHKKVAFVRFFDWFLIDKEAALEAGRALINDEITQQQLDAAVKKGIELAATHGQ